MKKIGKTLRKLRKDQKLTQEELAKLINVERSTIANWEREAKQPSLDMLIKYSQIFNISLDEIVGIKPITERKTKYAYDYILSDPVVNLLAKNLEIPIKTLVAFIVAIKTIDYE